MKQFIVQQNSIFWPIMITVGIGNLVAALSSTTVTIMLPVFMKEFSTDLVTVQ